MMTAVGAAAAGARGPARVAALDRLATERGINCIMMAAKAEDVAKALRASICSYADAANIMRAFLRSR